MVTYSIAGRHEGLRSGSGYLARKWINYKGIDARRRLEANWPHSSDGWASYSLPAFLNTLVIMGICGLCSSKSCATVKI